MALSALPLVRRERRVVTPELEAQLRLLDVQRRRSVARCYRPSKPRTTAPAHANAAPVVTHRRALAALRDVERDIRGTLGPRGGNPRRRQAAG